jgi:hypothetical protein
LGLVDGTKEFSPGLVEALGGLMVADGVSACIQLLEGDAGLEVLVGIGQGLALVAGVIMST